MDHMGKKTVMETEKSMETLYTGISRAAWGYFFLYFNLDINIGGNTVGVLPAFVGMALFLSAIELLKGERRDLMLLRPFSIVLTVWYLACWVMEIFGISLDDRLEVVSLLMSIAGMYFHFQMMTDFAALAWKYVPDDPELERRLLRWRTIQTVMLTLLLLLFYIREILPAGISGYFVYVMLGAGIVQIIAGICLMAALFSLRRQVLAEPSGM